MGAARAREDPAPGTGHRREGTHCTTARSSRCGGRPLAKARHAHGAAVWALACLPNKRVVAADGDGVLKVWRADLALGPRHALTCLQTLRGHARAAFCLAALPDGRIVSGSMDRTLRFWAPVGTQIDRGDAPSRTLS